MLSSIGPRALPTSKTLHADFHNEFSSLSLHPILLKTLISEGYTHPTPIQWQAIPIVLKRSDLIGCAQTGTGKTAAFALPILQLLMEKDTVKQPAKEKSKICGAPTVLVLTPTRELALQIHQSFCTYGRNTKAKSTVVFGGVPQRRQVEELRNNPDILIATPGRLLDLLNQKHLQLGQVSTFVLDEADRMLDMGFIHDVQRIVKQLPKDRQTMLFSATMPKKILDLASQILRDPINIAVDPVSSPQKDVAQYVFMVAKDRKCALLAELLRSAALSRVLVFTRTKRNANKVCEYLNKNRFNSAVIHANKSQIARQRALDGFKRGHIHVLVASDIAARGIDVESISHVINFDMPEFVETYVHRIGRTARAGAAGTAFSFCSKEERGYLAKIERHIKTKIPVKQIPA